jgi:hypothetical protein
MKINERILKRIFGIIHNKYPYIIDMDYKYDEDHNPISYSVNPVWVEREDMEEIHTLLDRMRDATLKPILSADNFPNEFDIEE